MHAYVSLNGKVLARDAARVHAVTGASLHGRGVFTTLAIHRAAPFMLREHCTRLAAHAAHIGMAHIGMDAAEIGAHLAALIEHNEIAEGRARISLLARSAGGVWREVDKEGEVDKESEVDEEGEVDKQGEAVDVLIVTGDRRPAPAEGLALTVSPYRLNTLSPLTGLKTTNYLDHILPWEEARARHFDESLMLNERGEIVSATLANIFWAIGGTLHTPALSCGALAGTTRALIINLADELAVPHVEGAYQLADIADADEIFLTSSNLGVAFCSAFDFRRYTPHAGSLAAHLAEALRQRTFATHDGDDEPRP